MAGREILVRIEHADGVAAVVRDRDMLWLTGDLDSGGGTGLTEYGLAVEGIGDRTVQGGRLPRGAVVAEVVDDAGVRHAATAANGAWVVVVDQAVRYEDPVVRFADANGKTIARPLPAEWPRSPVDDAPEPCPACGATGWDEVLPLDGSRHGRIDDSGNEEPLPIVVCRACGHEEPVGLFSYAETDLDETEIEAATEAWLREEGGAALRDLDMPVYAAQGWPAHLGSWGGTDNETDSVTVQHGKRPEDLTVCTEREGCERESEPVLARLALLSALGDMVEGWPSRSEAGLTVWLAAVGRDGRRVAATASLERLAFEIDGERRDFHLARAGSRWAAVRRQGDLVVTVTGDEIDPANIALVRLNDPTSLID
jgi:hypothetical protein